MGVHSTHLESSRLLTPYNLVLWCKNHSIFIHHSKCYRSLESRLSQSFFWRGNDIGVVPFVSTHILFPLDTTMNHTAQKTISKMCRAAMKSWSWMMMKLGNLILPDVNSADITKTTMAIFPAIFVNWFLEQKLTDYLLIFRKLIPIRWTFLNFTWKNTHNKQNTFVLENCEKNLAVDFLTESTPLWTE